MEDRSQGAIEVELMSNATDILLHHEYVFDARRKPELVMRATEVL